MLTLLADFTHLYGPLNIFRYITFRAAMAAATAVAIPSVPAAPVAVAAVAATTEAIQGDVSSLGFAVLRGLPVR